jgi:hypothetical protein
MNVVSVHMIKAGGSRGGDPFILDLGIRKK